jgi:hypothetical protein
MGLEEGGASLTEQGAVAQLVDRVLEVKTAQEWIGGDFRGTQDVPAAVGLDLGKNEELANAAVEIAPDPSMNGTRKPVHVGDAIRWHLPHPVAEPPAARRQPASFRSDGRH